MKDISKFDTISDYLPILNGSIIADLIVLVIVYYTPYFNSSFLKKWYETYRLSAVIADVLILVIGLVIARYVFKLLKMEWNFWKFLGVVLLIQIAHDIGFYAFFTNVPRGYHKMMDVFKDYADEVGIGALLGDSFMIAITVALSSYLAHKSVNTNIITLIISVYLIPYILYKK